MKEDMSLLPMLFQALHKKMMEQHQKLMEAHQLSKIHIPYIMMLSKIKEGLTQKELSDKTMLDKAHTSRAIRELIEKGIIEKDSDISYKYKLKLTNKGLELSELFKNQADQIHKKVFSSLDDDEIKDLRRLIQKLYQAID